jgi:hypothetical protein
MDSRLIRPRTPTRWAALAYGAAMFVALAIGLVAVELQAQAAGRGSKADWPWAVPFSALVVLLPSVAFAVTLRQMARHGLHMSPRASAAIAALLGALTPAVLLGVKPLVRALDIGSNFFGGLAVSQGGLCALAVLCAAGLAAWRRGGR